ncbi:MAG: hypothetical protein AAFV95_16530 [Bacteroidota bacterium]
MIPLKEPFYRLGQFSLWLLLLGGSTFSLEASCVYAQRMDAQEMEMGNLLTWSTSAEKDNQTFVIQKSLDGKEFVTEGIVRGAGESEATRHYRYLDISVGQSKAFYRLVDIDSKGLYSISETVVVNRNKENNLLITEMSETETDRYFTLTMQSNIQDQVEYQIFNEGNVLVQNGATEVVKGMNVLAMDLNVLESGRYRVSLQARGEQEEVFVLKKNKDGGVGKTNFALKKKDE